MVSVNPGHKEEGLKGSMNGPRLGGGGGLEVNSVGGWRVPGTVL